MKHKYCRALAVLVCMVMLVGALAFQGSAATVLADGTCGDRLSWSLDSKYTLTISGTGDMYDYLHDGYFSHEVQPWRDYVDSVKSIVITPGVTGIGEYAFQMMPNLVSVSIPNTVTRIGSNAFFACTGLTSVTIPEGVTTIPDSLFNGCSSLTTVVLPESLTVIQSGAFLNCYQLKNITIPAGVTEIGARAFEQCHSLTSITIPEGVTDLCLRVFDNCWSLVELTVPYTVDVVSGNVIWKCDSLKSITFTGHAPRTHWEWLNIWEDKSITVYYPAGDTTWTAEFIAESTADCGGNRTWVAREDLPVKHHYVETTQIATCTRDGFTRYDCSCGQGYIESEVPALGHDYSDYHVLREPTCTIQGLECYNCTRCSETINNVLPRKHNYENGFCTLCGIEEPPFEDVLHEEFYYDAVKWAVAEGITNGYEGTNLFGPNDNCTRAQVVTFLWRFAGEPEPESTENPFSDVAEGTWYYKAVLWAVERGITAGYLDTDTFGTDDHCTRGQIVTFLHRYAGEPAAASGENPFGDVPADEYYSEAVLWAVEQGITNGYAYEDTFCPEIICTRGQIVTFLCRYEAGV